MYDDFLALKRVAALLLSQAPRLSARWPALLSSRRLALARAALLCRWIARQAYWVCCVEFWAWPIAGLACIAVGIWRCDADVRTDDYYDGHFAEFPAARACNILSQHEAASGQECAGRPRPRAKTHLGGADGPMPYAHMPCA